MTEKQFENKIVEFLNKLDKCWHFKVWGGGFQKAGIPDIVGVINGKFFALEIKAEKGVKSKLQERNIRLLNEAGAYARFVYPKDFEDVKSHLLRLLEV